MTVVDGTGLPVAAGRRTPRSSTRHGLDLEPVTAPLPRPRLPLPLAPGAPRGDVPAGPATLERETPQVVPGRPWSTWYVPAAAVGDVLAGLVALVVATALVPLGLDAALAPWLPVIVPGVVLASFTGHGLYDPTFLGSGPEELRRSFRAVTHGAAAAVTVAFATGTPVAPLALATLALLVLAATTTARHLLRRCLHRARRRGGAMQRVVAVGHPDDVRVVVQELARERHHGLAVVAACVPGGRRAGTDVGVPVVGDLSEVRRAVRTFGADTVAAVSGPELTGGGLRRLSWELEATGTGLLVCPGLVEVAGPRLSIRPAAGLSLLHVEHASLSTVHRLAKVLLDRTVAAVALLLLAPVLAVIAVLVRATSPGPALYRQRRAGAGGREFTLIKFRSMVQDADARRQEFLGTDDGNGVLFKLVRDPRVTAVGARLRRYSLDELPQLFNVLRGHMSLVGPRPPLPEEVALYDDDAHRRLHVKPGLTGLWQISGRSDLSWEESLRLDLRYVDNWSMAMDLMIIWKTSRAVLRGSGAY